jgi:hypothetical protein
MEAAMGRKKNVIDVQGFLDGKVQADAEYAVVLHAQFNGRKDAVELATQINGEGYVSEIGAQDRKVWDAHDVKVKAAFKAILADPAATAKVLGANLGWGFTAKDDELKVFNAATQAAYLTRAAAVA